MFNNIYIYRSGGLGDVLWLEPTIKELSKKYKKVFLYTNFYELYQNYPTANVIVKKIPPGWFRAILKIANFLSGNKLYFRLDGKCYEQFPKLHFSHAYQQFFNLSLNNNYPTIYLSKDEKESIKKSKEAYAIIHLEPNANLNFRKVYGIDWQNIIDHLVAQNLKVFVINKENKFDNTTLFNGNIRQLISLVNGTTLFIGIDSGPSHIAASFQIPSILFFGAVNPEYRHFKNNNITIMQQPCEYAGCYHEVISGKGQPCKLVGEKGIPKCCVHTTESLTQNINIILKQHNHAR